MYADRTTATNLWHHPAAYDRVSKDVQGWIQSHLLRACPPSGRVLDIGCGTGRALDYIARHDVTQYVGIDLSAEMIAVARQKWADAEFTFMVGDFLEVLLDPALRFDSVLCIAALQWFGGRWRAALAAMGARVDVGGSLKLVFASPMDLTAETFAASRRIYREVHDLTVRRFQLDVASEGVMPRLAPKDVISELGGFSLTYFSSHELALSFSESQDFYDWHVGSGTALFMTAAPALRDVALRFFFDTLYLAYKDRRYIPLYATTCLNFAKRR